MTLRDTGSQKKAPVPSAVEAWSRNALVFIRERNLEQEFSDWCGGWPVPDCQPGSALERFTEYFVRNYPGPETIIHDPLRHAPKIFRAAAHAIARAE
jgi:hypothetical protein